MPLTGTMGMETESINNRTVYTIVGYLGRNLESATLAVGRELVNLRAFYSFIYVIHSSREFFDLVVTEKKDKN